MAIPSRNSIESIEWSNRRINRQEKDILIITELWNQWIVQWILIDNIDCWKLAMNSKRKRHLYVSDSKEGKLKWYRTNETLVASESDRRNVSNKLSWSE